MALSDIVIFGAGGLGREVLFQLREINKIREQYNILGFVDDSLALEGKIINGVPVLGNTNYLLNYSGVINVVVCIGNSAVRSEIVQKLTGYHNIVFPNIIAPDVRCSEYVTFGKGCIVCFSAIVTVDILIGDFVLVCNACTIGHDAKLDNFSTLYPAVNISGYVKIGSCSEIGAGAQIIQGKSIGDYSIVGAGAVVVEDIPSACTAVGIPAKPIKFKAKNINK